MIIYNVTFMMEQSLEQDFIGWMRGEALAAMVNPQSPAREPRLTVVAEVPGNPEFDKEARSYAFQVEFETLSVAREWAKTYLMPVLGQYTARYGAEHALSFATILQKVDL